MTVVIFVCARGGSPVVTGLCFKWNTLYLRPFHSLVCSVCYDASNLKRRGRICTLSFATRVYFRGMFQEKQTFCLRMTYIKDLHCNKTHYFVQAIY